VSPLTVDSHMHVIPDGVLDLIRQGRHPAGMWLDPGPAVPTVVHPEGYRYPLEREFHDVGALLCAIGDRGCRAAVVSPAPPLFGYDLERRASAESARLTNDGVAAMVKAHPGELAGMATLPMGNPEDAVEELIRAVSELGLVGAEIGPVAAGRWLDHPDLLPVLEQAQELGALLFVHPYYMGAKPGLEDLYLTNLVGNPLDTALCASRLILSGALDRLPELEVMLAHGGGYLPYQAGRLERGNAVRPELGLCEQVPTDYLSRFIYDTIVFDPAALRFLLDKVGAGRVVYGSDEPFDMSGAGIDGQLAGVELRPGERDAIVGGTIREVTGFLTEAQR
jgi:aminocarboxymuconate-semialdehyde decarboxylase